MRPLLFSVSLALLLPMMASALEVAIEGEDFLFDGKPTLQGRTWNGMKLEGLLPNARMVQGTFDDLNPETVSQWAYPDTKKWDAERNTNEFIAAMPEWRRHGLLAITLNLQGGSPYGYSRVQPWHNSAFEADGALRPDYMARAERIIKRADELGMAVILGYFYFGQDERLRDEKAVIRATDEATKWVLDHGWRNVLIEINNEANERYDHPILKPQRVHLLIERVKGSPRNWRRLLVGTSFGGGHVPTTNVLEASDFVLIHGNGVSSPAKMTDFIKKVRSAMQGAAKPIVINEDDHFDFEKPENNFLAATRQHVSWGLFDFRKRGESFQNGFQSVPVDWTISSPRKKAFFDLLQSMTGAAVK